jgi:hypothetical protein
LAQSLILQRSHGYEGSRLHLTFFPGAGPRILHPILQCIVAEAWQRFAIDQAKIFMRILREIPDAICEPDWMKFEPHECF